MLVVEDDRIARDALAAILQIRGHRVERAETVEGALHKLALGPTHVVLDLMLPDGDGALVLWRIRSKKLPAKVAVITGVNDEQRLRGVQALGVELILRKPYDPERLIKWLEPGDQPRASG